VVDSGAELDLEGAVSLDAATSITSAGAVVFYNSNPVVLCGTFENSGETEVDSDPHEGVTFDESFAVVSGNQIGPSLSIGFDATATFAEGGSSTFQELTLTSGTLSGPTDPNASPMSITVSNPSSPSGGLLAFTTAGYSTLSGDGTLTVAADASLQISGEAVVTLDSWTLDDQGTTTAGLYSPYGVQLVLADDAQWINEGTATFSASFTFNGQGSVVNTGMWIVNTGGASYFAADSNGNIPSFDNPGLFEVLSGSMQFEGAVSTDPFGSGNAQPAAGTSNESSALPNAQPEDGTGGNFSVSAGATLVFTGSVSSESLSVTGPGTVYFYPSQNFVFADGVITAIGSVTAETSTITIGGAGTVQLAGSVSVFDSTVNITNNSTNASGLVVSGLNQVVGAINGLGNVIVGAAGAAASLIANSIVLDQGSLTVGAGSSVSIASSPAAGNPLVEAQNAASIAANESPAIAAALAQRAAEVRARRLAEEAAAAGNASGVSAPPVVSANSGAPAATATQQPTALAPVARPTAGENSPVQLAAAESAPAQVAPVQNLATSQASDGANPSPNPLPQGERALPSTGGSVLDPSRYPLRFDPAHRSPQGKRGSLRNYSSVEPGLATEFAAADWTHPNGSTVARSASIATVLDEPRGIATLDDRILDDLVENFLDQMQSDDPLSAAFSTPRGDR
jgi:hypothetical protein